VTEDESEKEANVEGVASDSEAPKSSVLFEFLLEFEEDALMTLQSIEDMICAIVSLLLGLDYASRIDILQALKTLINYVDRLSMLDLSEPEDAKKAEKFRKPDNEVIKLVNLLGPLLLLKSKKNPTQNQGYDDLHHLKIRIARGEESEMEIFLLPTLDVC
jgi:hypothetical protein